MVTFRPLVAQGGGPATAGDSDVGGGTTVLLPAAAGLDVLGEVTGVDEELGDDEQLATAARTISAAAAPPIPLPERSTLGNTAVPPISWRPHAPFRPV